MNTNLPGGNEELGGALNEALGEIRGARAPESLGRGVMERAAAGGAGGMGREASDLSLTTAQWRVVGQGVAVLAILGVIGMSIWAIGGLSVSPNKDSAKEVAAGSEVVAGQPTVEQPVMAADVPAVTAVEPGTAAAAGNPMVVTDGALNRTFTWRADNVTLNGVTAANPPAQGVNLGDGRTIVVQDGKLIGGIVAGGQLNDGTRLTTDRVNGGTVTLNTGRLQLNNVNGVVTMETLTQVPALPQEVQDMKAQYEQQMAQMQVRIQEAQANQRQVMMAKLAALQAQYQAAGKAEDAAATGAYLRQLQQPNAMLVPGGINAGKWATATPAGANQGRLTVQNVQNLQNFRGQVGLSINLNAVGTTQGAVWGGANGEYTDDSALGAVAVHAGILKDGEAGTVKVTILPGRDTYQGTTANGVTSQDYAKWDGSFRIEKGDRVTITPQPRKVPAAPAVPGVPGVPGDRPVPTAATKPILP